MAVIIIPKLTFKLQRALSTRLINLNGTYYYFEGLAYGQNGTRDAREIIGIKMRLITFMVSIIT
jgi:hypothetical protein